MSEQESTPIPPPSPSLSQSRPLTNTYSAYFTDDGDAASLPSGPAPSQPRFMGQALYNDPGSPGIRDSLVSTSNSATVPGTPDSSSVRALAPAGVAGSGYRESTFEAEPAGEINEKVEGGGKKRRGIIILGAVAALIVVVLAVILPVYFTVIKPKNSSSSSSSSSSDPHLTSSAAQPTASSKPTVAITGGDGSTVTMDDGSTFIYRNAFGGYWYYDESDPFKGAGKAQSWSPAVNETFNYGVDKMRGVNLGGWLLTEPFIAPALYQKYQNSTTPAVDEWTLSEAMAADTASGGLNQLEVHYKTFITEKDFAEIASAGLNFVRIPIGWWAIETREGEPFLESVSWSYFLKAIKWARKYGIRINLDLHALPGSQNGWNHSGRLGTIGFLNGPMGYANAQRSLDYIRIIAEFISQPQYKDVVTVFGIINEPRAANIGLDNLASFYMEAYNIIRGISGTGEGNGPWISIHDGFRSRGDWVDVFPNADRLTLDSHPYMAFQGQSDAPMSTYAQAPCDAWGSGVNSSMANFGLTNAGEFSNAVTDCGLFLNGVGSGTRYEGTFDGSSSRQGSCTPWIDWEGWDDGMKRDVRNFALASMDALQDYFFWTWKIGNSSVSGKVESPAWSYQLGLENGWMPKDPRDAIGVCGNSAPWAPPLLPWQTGGAGAGNIPASATRAASWPPSTITNAGDLSTLPSYTPTGTIPTLAAPTVTSGVDAGNGWFDAQDTQGVFVPIQSCSYLDPWVNPTTAAVPPVCGGGATRARSEDEAVVTPPPSL